MPLTSHGRRTPLNRDRAERGRALSIDEVATRRLTFLASCERARARAYAAAGDTEAAQAANDNAAQAERIALLIKEGR